jgi:hypothetical protein
VEEFDMDCGTKKLASVRSRSLSKWQKRIVSALKPREVFQDQLGVMEFEVVILGVGIAVTVSNSDNSDNSLSLDLLEGGLAVCHSEGTLQVGWLSWDDFDSLYHPEPSVRAARDEAQMVLQDALCNA